MTKKFLLSGYFGFNNFGDDAILKVIVQSLQKNVKNADITVLSSNPSLTQELYSVKAQNSFDYLNLINAIKNTDVLVSGGGSLLQDVTSLKSLIYYLGIIFCARALGKEVIIYAQGIGPVKNPLGKFLTRFALRGIKTITVRDQKSYELLKSWNINSRVVPDPVWNMEISYFETKIGEVGVQLRNCASMNDKKLQKIAVAVNSEFGTKKINIISLQDVNDLEICQKFEKILKELNPSIKTEVFSKLKIEDAVAVLAEQEYLLAMRYHACLLAVKTAVPTLALSYDVKVSTLAAEANIPCVEMSKIDEISPKIAELKKLDRNNLIEFANKKMAEKSPEFEN